MLFQCHGAVEKRRHPGGCAEAISYLVSMVTEATARPLVLMLITVALVYLSSLRFHLEFQ
jgi:hypothetical protein